MNALPYERREPKVNQEHYDLLKQGVDAWNAWREEHPDVQPDLWGTNLSGADLGYADLSSADLQGSDLQGANLEGANLSEAFLYLTNLNRADLSGADLHLAIFDNADLIQADLEGADLSDAYLSNANLSHTYLRRTDLSGADLSGAHLNYANLSRTNLSRANLQGATIQGTIFTFLDLRTTKGIIEITHQGPSIIELQTVKLPQDGSALHFLRGAGVSDEWIDIYRSTMMKPIQYYSCFISYSSSDETLAKRLHADLQDHGVRCWFALHDLRPGQLFRKGIDEAIHLQDKLLLI
jgi:hypothetical protein